VRPWQAWLLALLLPCLVGQAGVPLFRAADGALAEAAEMGIERAARYRAVFVDVAALGAFTPDGRFQPAPEVHFHLFQDITVQATLERASQSPPNGGMWLGHVAGPAGGEVRLVFNGVTLAGTVVVAGQRYEIRNDGGPVHLIRELSPARSAELCALLSAPAAEVSEEEKLYRLTNHERETLGLQPLMWNDALANAARDHALDMGGRAFVDHRNPDGQGAGDRITAAGYVWEAFGENLAAGHASVEEVILAWMNNSGHRCNILSGADARGAVAFCDVGVGFAEVPGSPFGTYWVQTFGRRRGAATCGP